MKTYLWRVALGLVLTWVAAGMAWAATCTSVASGNWNAASTWSCDGKQKTPDIGDTVTIVSPYTVSLVNDKAKFSNLTIQAGATLSGAGQRAEFDGTVTNNGTATLGYLASNGNNAVWTQGSGATLTLSETPNNQWQGTLNAQASGNTVSFTDTAAAFNPQTYYNINVPTAQCPHLAGITVLGTSSCGGGGGGGGSCQALLPTLPSGGYPLISGTPLNADKGTTVNGVAATLTKGNNSLLSTAGSTNWSSASNALASPPSPIPTSTTLTTVGATPLAAGSYGDVRVNAGTGVFSGGSYFINELYVAPGATAQLAPGDYYLNKLTVGSSNPNTGGAITLSGSGLVRIFVTANAKSDSALYGGESGWWGGSSINQGGDPGRLQVLLYPTVTYLEIDDGTKFTGFVVQPQYGGLANEKPIDVHDGVQITGGLYSAGQVNMKKNVAFTYNAQVAAGIDALSNCSPQPVVEYRMDEASWNGALGEVKDASSNALHGSAKLGALPALAKICNGADLHNGAGASGQYLEVPHNALLNAATALTVTAWLKPNRWGGATDKDALMSFMSKDTNYEAHINTQGHVNWWWGGGQFNSTGTVPIGVWTHVTLVYQSGQQTIYLNGAASGTATFTGTLPATVLPFQIGDDQLFGGGTRRFDGMIDEVKVFNVALSAAQVATGVANESSGKNWDGTARACPVYGPHHLEISDAGNGVGLTCTPSTLTIKACADAACTLPYTSGFSGTLTASGAGTVNWGAGTPNFVISAGSSTVTKTLQLTAANADATATLGASSTAANPASCTFAACSYTAYNAGFLFDVPHHVAGVAQTVVVRSVKRADNSGACVPGLANVTRTLQMSCSYTNPTAGTLPVQVNNRYLNPGNSAGSMCAASSPVSLTFDATGAASATVRYPDAGDMGLNLSYTGTAGTGDAGLVMQGADTFVAVPASLVFSGIPAAPLVAGVPFAVTVTAMNGASPAEVTKNFGNETAPESVTLSHTLFQPTGASAVNGSLNGEVWPFAAGVASVGALVWSEVGLIDLSAALVSGSYLGSGKTASGTTGSTGAVGPFVPHHFDVTVVHQGCDTGGFTYSGQPVTLKVSAMNAYAELTQNYYGSAATASNFARAITLSDANALGLGAFAPASAAASAFVFVNGTADLDGLANPKPAYTFTNPLTAPKSIAVRAVDSDGVSSSGFAEGVLAVRSGRLALQNGYGSELLALPIPLEAQYWTGSFYATNSDDSCTLVSVPPAQTLLVGALPNGVPALYFYPLVANQNQLLSSDAIPSLASPLQQGKSALQFAKSDTRKPGWLDIILKVESYLQGNWGNCSGQTGVAGAMDDLPCARATFGIYKSPLIYRRENY